MKKNVKRLATLGLIAIMGATLLSACGKKGDNQDGSTESGKKTTLTFGIWDENQRPTMENLASAYEAKNNNVDVEIQLTPYKGGEYWTKLEASATGGTAPDVFWLNTLHAESYKDGGILLDLTDYLAKSDMKIEENYPKALISMYKFDDKMYAIPKDFDTNALWYNKAIFDKAGVDYPTDDWTWDDFVATSQKLKDAGLDTGVYPVAAPLDFQTDYYPTIYANGGWILNEDKTETGYEDPKTQEGIQIWIDLINAGLSPDLATMTDTSADAMFEAGKLAMIFAGSYMTPQYMSNDVINKNVNLVEFPEFNGVEPNIINGLGYAVYSGSKNQEAAVDFALWLGSTEAMKIQGEGGAVISARNDAQQYFAQTNPDLNLAAYTNHSDVAYPLPVCKSSAELYDLEANQLKWAYSGEKTLAETCKELKTQADAILDKMNK